MTAIEFFAERAGLCIEPGETEEQARMRCARELAEAESFASDAGVSFQWEIDPDCDSSEWQDGPAHALWFVLAWSGDGEVIGSLGGVDFGPDGSPWGDPYRRVVEAELAADYMASEL